MTNMRIPLLCMLSTIMGSIVNNEADIDPASYLFTVVFGDIHGDLESFIRSIYLAWGRVDEGETPSIMAYELFRVLVFDILAEPEDSDLSSYPQLPLSRIGESVLAIQVGDYLDRGPESVRCFKLVHYLERIMGWKTMKLFGNHELLNFLGDADEYIHPKELVTPATGLAAPTQTVSSSAINEDEENDENVPPVTSRASSFQEEHISNPNFGTAQEDERIVDFMYGGKHRTRIVESSYLAVRLIHTEESTDEVVSGEETHPEETADHITIPPLRSASALFIHGGVDLPFVESLLQQYAFYEGMDDSDFLSPEDLVSTLNEIVRSVLSVSLNRSPSDNPMPLIDAHTLSSGMSPLWTRNLSTGAQEYVCRSLLPPILSRFRVARILIGHTPQLDRRMKSLCGSRIILVDAAMSKWIMKSDWDVSERSDSLVDEDHSTGEVFFGNPSVLVMEFSSNVEEIDQDEDDTPSSLSSNNEIPILLKIEALYYDVVKNIKQVEVLYETPPVDFVNQPPPNEFTKKELPLTYCPVRSGVVIEKRKAVCYSASVQLNSMSVTDHQPAAKKLKPTITFNQPLINRATVWQVSYAYEGYLQALSAHNVKDGLVMHIEGKDLRQHCFPKVRESGHLVPDDNRQYALFDVRGLPLIEYLEQSGGVKHGVIQQVFQAVVALHAENFIFGYKSSLENSDYGELFRKFIVQSESHIVKLVDFSTVRPKHVLPLTDSSSSFVQKNVVNSNRFKPSCSEELKEVLIDTALLLTNHLSFDNDLVIGTLINAMEWNGNEIKDPDCSGGFNWGRADLITMLRQLLVGREILNQKRNWTALGSMRIKRQETSEILVTTFQKNRKETGKYDFVVTVAGEGIETMERYGTKFDYIVNLLKLYDPVLKTKYRLNIGRPLHAIRDGILYYITHVKNPDTIWLGHSESFEVLSNYIDRDSYYSHKCLGMVNKISTDVANYVTHLHEWSILLKCGKDVLSCFAFDVTERETILINLANSFVGEKRTSFTNEKEYIEQYLAEWRAGKCQ